MQMNEKVLTALEVLKDCAENEFELHRIEVLIQDLTDPPVAEQIDNTHQQFNGITYYQNKKGHYQTSCMGIHRAIWSYYHGNIPTDTAYEVHHKDLNPANNDISNLQLLQREKHKELHALKTAKAPREKICLCCGKTFTRKQHTQKYCSVECANKAHTIYDRNKNCLSCGKHFIGRKDTPNQKYCSLECYYKAIKKPRIEKACPVCGKKFTLPRPSYKKTYCSISCAKKAQYSKQK